MTSGTHIMLFDPYAGGHHGQYIRHVIAYWLEHRESGHLDLAIPDGFLEAHADVRECIEDAEASAIQTIATPRRSVGYAGALSLMRTDWAHGRTLRRLIEERRPDYCLVMYVDHLFLSLSVDLRFSFPVDLAGIYFRPSFHYPA